MSKKNEVLTNASSGRLIDIKTIAKIGILSAIAALLMLLEFPLVFVPGFYKLDFSEVMVLLGAFSMGPVVGIIIEAIKIVLNFALDGTTTAGVGEMANFIIGCSFVVPAALIYKRHKTRKGAVIGMIVGIIVNTIIAAFMNYYILIPVYSVVYGMPLDVIIGMGTKVNPNITNLNQLILFATIPFNLLKGTVASAITFLSYKRVSKLLHS